MRGVSIIAFAVALCVSFVAHAQKANQPLPKKAKAKQVQKASAILEHETASSAVKVIPAAPAEATSSTSLQTAVPAKTNRFGFSFLTFHDVVKGSIQDSNPSAYGIWRATARYSLTDILSLSYTQEFQNFYASTKAEARWQINNGRFQLLNSKIATLPGDITIDGFIRAYVPTGENVRFKTKYYTALYGNLNASKSFGKLDLSYSFLSWYQVNSQDYFLVTDAATGAGKPQANVDFIIENYLAAGFTISPKLSASVTTGIVDTYFRGIPVKGVNRDTALYSEASMSFKAVKNVSLGAAIFNSTSFTPNNDFKYFADNETYYRALVNVSL